MNSPILYNDPTGHMVACEDGCEGARGSNGEEIHRSFDEEDGGRRDGLFADYYMSLHEAIESINEYEKYKFLYDKYKNTENADYYKDLMDSSKIIMDASVDSARGEKLRANSNATGEVTIAMLTYPNILGGDLAEAAINLGGDNPFFGWAGDLRETPTPTWNRDDWWRKSR